MMSFLIFIIVITYILFQTLGQTMEGNTEVVEVGVYVQDELVAIGKGQSPIKAHRAAALAAIQQFRPHHPLTTSCNNNNNNNNINNVEGGGCINSHDDDTDMM